MIYLFCDSGYGRQFFQACVRHCGDRGLALTVVYSARRARHPGSPARRLFRKLRGWYRAVRIPRVDGLSIRWIADVNDPRFIESIDLESHAVIAGFNQIFGRNLIDRFLSVANFHPSVLPNYRGPVPSYWCVRNGERKTGYTLHRVTERIDSGEILYQEAVEIGFITDPSDLDERIARAAVPTLIRYLDQLDGRERWPVVTVSPDSVYSSPIRYASFPSTREP